VNSEIFEDKCFEMVKKLIRVQLKSGGWPTFYGNPRIGFTFDTIQIIKGLQQYSSKLGKANPINSELDKSIKRAKKFLGKRINRRGEISATYNFNINYFYKNLPQTWAHGTSPINLKIHELKKYFYLDKKFIHKIDSTTNWGLEQPQLLESHPGAYQLEGLIEIDKAEVKRRLFKFFLPTSVGFIAGKPQSKFSYNSGSAQLAILLHKCGYSTEASAVKKYIIEQIKESEVGGLAFPQYSGFEKPHQEFSTWGIKYFCEFIRETNAA
jgi:hypothetical protein